MKEVLTKSFWHGVKKTYDEARVGLPPVEGDLGPAPRSETPSASGEPIDPIEESSQESFPASDSPAWAMGSEKKLSDEHEIRQLVSTWMAATKAGDIDKVLSLMADDVVFLVPGQPAIFKAGFAAAARAQSGRDAPQLDASSEIQEIQILGDWAFMWTKLTVVLTPSGGSEPLTRAGHTLTILKKQSGRWVLARDANLLIPAPNPG